MPGTLLGTAGPIGIPDAQQEEAAITTPLGKFEQSVRAPPNVEVASGTGSKRERWSRWRETKEIASDPNFSVDPNFSIASAEREIRTLDKGLSSIRLANAAVTLRPTSPARAKPHETVRAEQVEPSLRSSGRSKVGRLRQK